MEKVIMVNPDRMEYKGYAGDISYDLKSNMYSVKTVDPEIALVSGCEGKTIYDLQAAFLQAVEGHISMTAE